jgi:arsenical pump membrane protein
LIPEWLAFVAALLALAASLGVAIARPPWLSEAVTAAGAGTLLVVVGAVSLDRAREAISNLAPTVAFLAALLLLADGCRRYGLFEALGKLLARGSRDSPSRLLALVFVSASSVTAVLGLDPTIVLLTPVVFATATRLRMSPTPHVYACSHLANTASLLLPVSNLTNLLAYHASGLSFTRFAELTALPTAGAIVVEWVVINRFFASDLRRPCESVAVSDDVRLPRFAIGVLAGTLVGFLASSPLGISPLWVAVAGAGLITAPGLVRRTVSPRHVVRALAPAFLVFVLGLGVIVAAMRVNGLDSAIHVFVPNGHSLLDLLAIAVIAAVLANVVNNLPAILMLTPVIAPLGPGLVLAALIGVNIGPNLTYIGSLATLLWRRILRQEDTEVNLAQFSLLGALTVPAGILVSTLLLFAGLEVGT